MKKTVQFLLCFLLACTMIACGNTEQSDSSFIWTRQGSFIDENDNYLSITPSEMEENPGWAVSFMNEDRIYGWFIQQEGNTLHGNLVAPDLDEDDYIVTISEEGEDGVKLETESGDVYHFTVYEIPEAAITVTINTNGFGEITYAQEGQELSFDNEYPSQSAYLGLEGPETFTIAARPDEGYKFIKWTNNGADYSSESTITVEFTENTDLVAVFGVAGTDETPVDLENVTTLGELLGLPNYGTACYEKKYVYAFEQDGNIYRAIANLTEEEANAIFSLDFDDAEYDRKLQELISPLQIDRIENMSEMVPPQEELDTWIGKTGEELFNAGWINSGWNLQDMEFYMSYGCFSYIVGFEGTIENPDTFDEEDINPLIVTSVTYQGLGDITYLPEE